MRLRRKLLLSMLTPALLLGMVGVTGFYSLRHLASAAETILSDNYRSIQGARRMSRSLRLLEAELPASPAGAQTSADALAAELEEALRLCEGNVTEAGESAILRRIRAAWHDWRSVSRAPTPVAAQTMRASASQALHAEIERLVALNEQAMIASERETRRVARVMLSAVAVSAVAAFVALALFALVSAHRISRPIVDVADRLHEALNPASTSKRASFREVDEIARLREELDALLRRLARHEDEHERRVSHLQGRLSFVMNEVLEGLVLMDTQHAVLAANRVGRAILGIAEGDDRSVDALSLRNDVRQILGPVLEGTVRPEQDLGEVRFPLGGDERVFRPRVLSVPATDGAVEGYLILFWDVTEQRRFEESRRRFIAMLSHQLKTPMTSLTMSVNLLRERLQGMPPAEEELLSITAESCRGLASLIADLVGAAQDVTPELLLQPRRVDLARLLRSSLRPLVPQARDKGVELVLPAEADAVPARVDPVKFPWVVTNIAGNALRYTGRGGSIVVATRVAAQSVEVVVRDTGTGIARTNLERVFQPYVSLDREPQPGTHGLGLAIAKEIVEAHGGTIEARSEEGRGTEFVIRLPSEGGMS